MLTVHPPAFIETQGCDGPRYIRGQPSREEGGVLMTEIQDKYIAEFELPYRNVNRYIREIANDWNRLNPQQKQSIQNSFDSMGLSSLPKEQFTNEIALSDCVTYLTQNPNQIGPLLTQLWGSNNTDVQNQIQQWTSNQTFNLHSNWKIGALIFGLVIAFLLIGIISGYHI